MARKNFKKEEDLNVSWQVAVLWQHTACSMEWPSTNQPINKPTAWTPCTLTPALSNSHSVCPARTWTWRWGPARSGRPPAETAACEQLRCSARALCWSDESAWRWGRGSRVVMWPPSFCWGSPGWGAGPQTPDCTGLESRGKETMLVKVWRHQTGQQGERDNVSEGLKTPDWTAGAKRQC